MTKQYFCDCEKRCKGRFKEVSRSTYQRHASFREPPIPAAPSTRGGPGGPLINSQSGTREQPASDPQQTHRGTNLAGTGAAATPVRSREGNDLPDESPVDHEGGLDRLLDSPQTNIGANHETGNDPSAASEPEDYGQDMTTNATGTTSMNSSVEVRPDPGCLEETQNENEEPLPPSTVDLEELSNLAKLTDIKIAMQFIQTLEKASLDGPHSQLNDDALARLRNPPKISPRDMVDPDLRLGLDLFLATVNSSQKTYSVSRSAVLRRHPEDEVPSYEQIKRRITGITGVESIVDNMCPNSCVAFTGPFSELENCPECGEPRYDPFGVARQELHTMPLGPQLQALFRDPESAQNMSYRRRRTVEIIQELELNHGRQEAFHDFLDGQEYIDAVRTGRIEENDIVLMLSFDGAQLYAHKASDCWIVIWIIFDHAPDKRYKKSQVLAAAVIPGPQKPKNMDSVLFPSLYHLAALQHEGLPIWDAWRNRQFITKPFLALATADGPAMAYLNGLVGHHGKFGCRLYCSLIGRRKGPHYYPALLKPHNYDIEGCDHGDLSYANLPSCSLELYYRNLRHLMASPNETQYKKRRLETGISKPSIFLGLQQAKTLQVPSCFGSDIMHLLSLNIPDLLINLWRGMLDCDKNDDRTTWDWATLTGDVWERHGRQVADATPYLPGSFDRPPRNPAEKISSGYKAWEFLIYIFGLGPGLLYNVLPEKYWRNFCKLVYGVRIMNQHTIKVADLQKAHQRLLEFAHEFELLYYQRRAYRLHFIRQSIHAVTHLAPEVIRVGPAICSSQWTMERTIGNLGQEIRQPSNPFANLSQRGLQRCQINALKAMIPDLDPPPPDVPYLAKDLGDGFVLLRAKDKMSQTVRTCERDALLSYLKDAHSSTVDENWTPMVCRWARLRLPNGQVARSAWKEKIKPLNKVRMARNIKFHSSSYQLPEFAEVIYYFQIAIGEIQKTLAMVSRYSPPHAGLLELSYHTLWSCTYQGDASLAVIDVKTISAVVAMVPHRPFTENPIPRFFVVEKPGLDIASLGGNSEDIPDEG